MSLNCDERKTQTNEKVDRRMIVQSESLPSREEGREVGCCWGLSVIPTRELQKVLLGVNRKIAMMTNCVVKGGREIADASYDVWNFEFFMK
ncbi:hypothetical protein NPIL_526481 [Nephila pilipes]|uniref:Uncharacterized protein n=1 Tax=Nephila pilipes TaxID=299642 RepID=A0A8X6NBB8_NEPPI|nr:hypothetical protein NPIL_526481 [Nephila pilipes]